MCTTVNLEIVLDFFVTVPILSYHIPDENATVNLTGLEPMKNPATVCRLLSC